METGPAGWMRIAVEIVACTIMVAGVVGVFIDRFRSKRGIDARTIQLLTVTLLLPAILLLSLEGELGGQTTAALIGVVTGYVLSGTGKGDGPA